MTYLLADNIRGTWAVEELDDQGAEILGQHDFYESLDSLGDGEMIGARVDAEMYAKIDAEYGIDTSLID